MYFYSTLISMHSKMVHDDVTKEVSQTDKMRWRRQIFTYTYTLHISPTLIIVRMLRLSSHGGATMASHGSSAATTGSGEAEVSGEAIT